MCFHIVTVVILYYIMIPYLSFVSEIDEGAISKLNSSQTIKGRLCTYLIAF